MLLLLNIGIKNSCGMEYSALNNICIFVLFLNCLNYWNV